MLQHSVPNALVSALRVVVLDVLAKGPSERRLPERALVHEPAKVVQVPHPRAFRLRWHMKPVGRLRASG
jgi:hypothetical protein